MSRVQQTDDNVADYNFNTENTPIIYFHASGIINNINFM